MLRLPVRGPFWLQLFSDNAQSLLDNAKLCWNMNWSLGKMEWSKKKQAVWWMNKPSGPPNIYSPGHVRSSFPHCQSRKRKKENKLSVSPTHFVSFLIPNSDNFASAFFILNTLACVFHLCVAIQSPRFMFHLLCFRQLPSESPHICICSKQYPLLEKPRNFMGRNLWSKLTF